MSALRRYVKVNTWNSGGGGPDVCSRKDDKKGSYINENPVGNNNSTFYHCQITLGGLGGQAVWRRTQH